VVIALSNLEIEVVEPRREIQAGQVVFVRRKTDDRR